MPESKSFCNRFDTIKALAESPPTHFFYGPNLCTLVLWSWFVVVRRHIVLFLHTAKVCNKTFTNPVGYKGSNISTSIGSNQLPMLMTLCADA